MPTPWATSRSGATARWRRCHLPRLRPLVRRLVACGYVPKALAAEEEGWEIEILGDRRPARLQRHPLFDPNGAAMRG